MTPEERKAERDLYEKPIDEWTLDELRAELTKSYAPSTIPPCWLCGAQLSCESFGGGEPTSYACTALLDAKPAVGEARDAAWDHYRRTQYKDYRRGGDRRVMELLRRVDARRDVSPPNIETELAHALLKKGQQLDAVGEDYLDNAVREVVHELETKRGVR